MKNLFKEENIVMSRICEALLFGLMLCIIGLMLKVIFDTIGILTGWRFVYEILLKLFW